jgi:hypothetical protein
MSYFSCLADLDPFAHRQRILADKEIRTIQFLRLQRYFGRMMPDFIVTPLRSADQQLVWILIFLEAV